MITSLFLLSIPTISPTRDSCALCFSYFWPAEPMVQRSHTITARLASGNQITIQRGTRPLHDIRNQIAIQRGTRPRNVRLFLNTAEVNQAPLEITDDVVFHPDRDVDLIVVQVEIFDLTASFLSTRDNTVVIFQGCHGSHTVADVLDAWRRELERYEIHTERNQWQLTHREWEFLNPWPSPWDKEYNEQDPLDLIDQTQNVFICFGVEPDELALAFMTNDRYRRFLVNSFGKMPRVDNLNPLIINMH